jgi:hypothetical protein
MAMNVRSALSIGNALPPVAWMASTSFNYAIAEWQCRHSTNVTLPVAIVLGILALIGALLSGWTARSVTGSARLLGFIGLILGLLSAAIVFVQGAATLVVSTCAR